MGFASLDLDIDHDMVVFLADNGVGKSSLLKALRVGLGGWMLGIPGAYVPPIERWMMRYELRRLGYELSKEPSGPTTVTTTALLTNAHSSVSWSRTRRVGDGRRTDRRAANSIRDLARTRITLAGTPLPLFAYYGARRRVPSPVTVSTSGPQARTNAYNGTLKSSIDYGKRFARWRRLRDQAAHNDAAAPVHSALIDTLAQLLPGAIRVSYDSDFEEPIVEFEADCAGGGIRAFSALSDGFQNILGIGLDLALRAIQLNPQLGGQVFEQTTGVVLIDEVDQHLHPTWQRAIPKGLRDAFPKVQFILATHSPLVAMGAAPYAKIIRLRTGDDGAIAETLDPKVLGPTVDEALRGEAFEVATTWSPAVLALTEARLTLLKQQQKTPEDPELNASLAANQRELDGLRREPLAHIEDLVRVAIADFADDVTTLTPEQIQRLRARVLERLRRVRDQ